MKRLLVTLMCLTLLVGLFTGGILTASAETKTTDLGYQIDFSEEPYEVRMVMTVQANLPAQEGIDRVVSRINEMTLRDLNMTLKVEIMSFAQFMQVAPLELAAMEKMDLVSIPYGFGTLYTPTGYFNDLNTLIDTYGPHILSTYTSESLARACTLKGFMFGLPVHKENCFQSVIIMRTDILEKYGIDPASIKTRDDLDTVYEKVYAGEPDMWMCVLGKDMGNLAYLTDNATGANYGPTLLDITDPTVTNYYASEQFATWCKVARRWQEKGWVNPAAATDDQYLMTMMSGQAFSMFYAYNHPLVEPGIEAMMGCDVTIVPMDEPFVTTESSAAWCYAIPTGSKAPEKAMMMLDYLMTQPEPMNLLNWGEENVDYVVKDDVLDYPEGVDASNVGYHFDQGWILPNQLICTPWINYGADVYKRIIEYNKTAKESVALGFSFDPTGVQNEVAACRNVCDEYYNALNTGSVDPDEYLPEFNQALMDAGLQTIIDEVQRQLDVYVSTKD